METSGLLLIKALVVSLPSFIAELIWKDIQQDLQMGLKKLSICLTKWKNKEWIKMFQPWNFQKYINVLNRKFTKIGWVCLSSHFSSCMVNSCQDTVMDLDLLGLWAVDSPEFWLTLISYIPVNLYGAFGWRFLSMFFWLRFLLVLGYLDQCWQVTSLDH